jgi:hypothetical protein
VYDKAAIFMIIINGNFTSIPSKAFYPLRTLYQADIYIQRALQYPALKLDIANDAFQTFIPNTINTLEFDYFTMDAVPSAILNGLTCSQFSMVYGSLDKVGANDFNGLTTNEISIYYNGLKTIDPNAFNGLKFDPEEGLSLFFNYNNLTEISSAFKSINASSVYLLYNQISQIPDFAFSSCNQLSGCTNLLTNLFISNNPITTIGDNALANLPNLAQLDFSQLNLISIPVEAISKVAASLQIIDFTANQITKIEANSFYNFERLNSLSVNYNPIVNIELGAFNGMSSMQALLFMGLPRLTSVDLLITYGMEQVASLQFQYCPRLTNVTVLDAAKLPQTLETVTFSTGTNVQTLDSEFQSWLRQSPSKILDISNNVNFICSNSISWMAKFAICSPVQIITNGARCANSNTTLVDYLSNVKPTC